MKVNLKEKILINPNKIKDILNDLGNIKKTTEDKTLLDKIEIIERKCYNIIVKKNYVLWDRRLRKKKFEGYKIKKKGTIYKIK